MIYSLNEILKKIKLFKEIYATPEFESDFKNLLKKYKTLIEDFEIFIKAQLFLFHKKQIDNKGIVLISDTGIISPKIYKAKKFSCKASKLHFLCEKNCIFVRNENLHFRAKDSG